MFRLLVAAAWAGSALAQPPVSVAVAGAAAATATSAAAGPVVDAPAVRILKGVLLQWNIRGLAGDMLLEEEGARRWRCRVSPETYLSRSRVRIHPAGVREGDLLEVVADLHNVADCKALTIYLQPPDPRRVRLSLPWTAYSSSFLDNLMPRGVLTFAGVVKGMENRRLYLHTRKSGDRSFALRDDTVFRHDGRTVDASTLDVHTRVFVRASRTFEGDVEVYQVIWGDILTPGR